jgi:hypothetical protein
MRPWILMSLVMLVAALSGCSAPEPARECLEVPAETLAAIAEGGTPPLAIAEGAAVLSDDFAEPVYMIAGRFPVEGNPDQVGVWASDSLQPAEVGPVFAADGIAQEFTQWPSEVGDTTFDMTVDGVSAASDCLG